jgi:hypothetical protein
MLMIQFTPHLRTLTENLRIQRAEGRQATLTHLVHLTVVTTVTTLLILPLQMRMMKNVALGCSSS